MAGLAFILGEQEEQEAGGEQALRTSLVVSNSRPILEGVQNSGFLEARLYDITKLLVDQLLARRLEFCAGYMRRFISTVLPPSLI